MSDHILGLLMTQAWQITALAIVVAVVVKLAAKNRPHLAHALWVLVLIKCVTPPLWGHSIGVFSQLQARFMPGATAFLPDATNSPPSMSVAIAETPISAPEIDQPNPGHGPPETYEPDELLSMADTEPSEDAGLRWNGGTEIGLELDETVQTLDKLEANIAYAEPALPVESEGTDASWLRHGWLLPSGLAAGAIMTLFIMVIRCLRCLREIHRHRTTEFDDPLRERIQHLSRQLRIRRIPQIIVSDVLFGPAVLGLLRHTIVLPRCLLTSAETSIKAESGERKADARDAEQHATTACKSPLSAVGFPLSFLDPILAHELLHIRRGDLRTGTLQAIAQSLWWFHPAVWLSNRWLSREAERCCDEQVIAELGCTPGQYARSLLSVIECKHQLQPIPVFPGMKPVEITTQRMERIMSLRNGLKKRTPLWCWLVILALAFVVLPGAVAEPSLDEPNPSAGSISKILSEPNARTTVRDAPSVDSGDSSSVAFNSAAPPSVTDLPIRLDRETATAKEFLRGSDLQERLEEKVSGKFVGERLSKILAGFKDRYNIQFLFADDVCKGPTRQIDTLVLVDVQNEPLKSALTKLLRPLGLTFEVRESAVIVKGFKTSDFALETMKGLLSIRHDQRVAESVSMAPPIRSFAQKHESRLQVARQRALEATLRKKVSLNFENTGLMEVLRSLAKDHGINIASRGFNESTTVTFQCQDEPLGEAIKTILEPFGLCMRPANETILIEFADPEHAMEKFRSLPGPPSFAVFGILKNTGWQLLEKEIRLLDAITLAGGVVDPEGVAIEITNPEIMSGKAIPVSMSLRVLQIDESGKLNRIVKDGDMISVTRNGSFDALPVQASDGVVMSGNGVTNNSGLTGTLRSDDPAGQIEKNKHWSSPPAKESSTSMPLFVSIYPVADLVVLQQPVIAAVSQSSENENQATRASAAASAQAVAPEKTSDKSEPMPHSETQKPAPATNYKADFAPLTELIKATVQPDSWDAHGKIAVDEKSLSLIIAQTQAAHDEILELLSQLRNAQDQNVRIPCLVVHLTKESQTKWLEEQCSLHPLEHGSRWALLPRQRCESFTQALLEQKPEVLSRPVVRTISGQTPTITVGQTAVGVVPAIGIRLEVTPHLLPDSKVIRLQHSFSIGEFANEMPQPVESLVGSGQTLLLLINDPEDKEKPDAVSSQYLLMMTPEHIPQKDEAPLNAPAK